MDHGSEPPGAAYAGRETVQMWTEMIDRTRIEADLCVARRRAWALTPYSPAWDAAMAMVEDLERAMSQHDRASDASQWQNTVETRMSPAHA